MKIVVIRHRVLPGAADTALARIKTLSERMKTQPGFCFRHTGSENGDQGCVTSVTAWNTDADFSAWEAHLAASPLPSAGQLYSAVERINIDVDEAQ